MPTDITVAPPAPIDLSTVSGSQTVLTVTLPPGQYRPAVNAAVTSGSITVYFNNASGALVSEGRFGASGFAAFSDFVLPVATALTIVLIEGSPIVGTLTDLTFLYIGAAGTTTATPVNTRTYRGWKDAVIAYTERPELEPDLDTILAPVQARLARELNARSGETSAVVSVVAGAATLPDGYKDIRAVLYEGHPLVYVGPEEYRGHWLIDPYHGAVSTTPGIYTIEGDSILVGPVPADTATVTLTVIYYGTPGTLVADTDTHTLLDEAYDLYIYAGVAELYDYAVESAEADRYIAKYEIGKRRFNEQQLRSRTATNKRANKPRPGMIV